MTLLHEEHLRAFVVVWRAARQAGVALPATADPNYASLEVLLQHVLRAARGYAVVSTRSPFSASGIGRATPTLAALSRRSFST